MNQSKDIIPFIRVGNSIDGILEAKNFYFYAKQKELEGTTKLLASVNKPIDFNQTNSYTVKSKQKELEGTLYNLLYLNKSIEEAPILCFDVKYPVGNLPKKEICTSKDKNSRLYNAISKINEQVLIDAFFTSDNNIYYHYLPYLCGYTIGGSCATAIVECDILESDYWEKNNITIPIKSNDDSNNCFSGIKNIDNEYLKTVSYLAKFYKDRIPFNPKNIDYYLETIMALPQGETSFDIICIHKDHQDDPSRDILYHDWLYKLSSNDKDNYLITNNIFIKKEYREIVFKDIDRSQGRYSIMMRGENAYFYENQTTTLQDIETLFNSELNSIENTIINEEYEVAMDRIETLRLMLSDLATQNEINEISSKLDIFAKIVSDAFESI